MVARIPQMNISARLTLDSLKKDIALAACAASIKGTPYAIFSINHRGDQKLSAYESQLAALTAALTESMLGILRYGDGSMLDEYFNVLKDRAISLGGKIHDQSQIIVAQNILSSYVQSSLSLCQLYGWIYNHDINNDVIQTVLTHTCTLLTYAAYSKEICEDMLFTASVIVTHWKTDLADVNFARFHIILMAAELIGITDGCCWGTTEKISCNDILVSSRKGTWCVDLYNSFQGSNTDSFRMLCENVRKYTWDNSVDLLKDAKTKRRICERAHSVKITTITSTKEINRLATEQLHPVLTDILTICRVAMSSKENFVIQSSQETSSSLKSLVFQPESSALQPEPLDSMLMAADIAFQAAVYTSQEKRKHEESLAELQQLREENTRLKKECRKYRKQLQNLEKTRQQDDSDKSTYSEQEMLKVLERVKTLEAEAASLRKYANSVEKQQKYIAQLKTQLAEAHDRLDAVLDEKNDLQETYDVLVAQQQVVEQLELQSAGALTDEELAKLKQIRVYGIAPDTAAMSKLSNLMPSSKIVLVGQNMSLHEDIPANYDLYFFVAALAGHKVYKKWRSRVNAMKVPYCHCNSSGYAIVARQILLEYDRQVLKS